VLLSHTNSYLILCMTLFYVDLSYQNRVLLGSLLVAVTLVHHPNYSLSSSFLDLAETSQTYSVTHGTSVVGLMGHIAQGQVLMCWVV